MAKSSHVQPFAVVPLVILLTAIILSFLCLFVGNQPGFMDDYAIVTVNVSRIGRNTLDKIDNKILGLNVTNIITKRDEIPVVVVSITAVIPTPAPTAELDPRQLGAFLGGISSDVASLKSKAGSAVSSAAASVESKASSVEGIVVSKISSAIASLQTAAVRVVDDVYYDVVTGLNLTDFYALNLRTTCQGQYVSANGTNLTASSTAASVGGLKKDVDVCSKHSSFNPLTLIRVLFIIAISFSCLALVVGVWGLVRFTRFSAGVNVLAVMPALGFLAVATAITHGVAVGASAFLNFFGDVVGTQVTYGGKFFAMAWAAVVLLFLDFAFWSLLLLTGDRLPSSKRRDQGLGVSEEKRSYESR